MTVYHCDATALVEVTVKDQIAIDRCVENHDEDGVPQPDVKGGTGWRNVMYDLRDESDVIDHWVGNALHNGVTDIHVLDGWADLPRGTVTMTVTDVHLQGFQVPIAEPAE